MSWWGKLFGGTFGYMLGGPLGALIGAALGHQLDAKLKNINFNTLGSADRERIQTAFFTATFSIMGYLAKADGRVSKEEIRVAQDIMDQMQLEPEVKALAQRLFNEGKQPDFPFDEVLDQFKKECHRRHSLMRVFLEILLQAAYADGVLHEQERKILLVICERLGFSQQEFQWMERLIASASGARGHAGQDRARASRGYSLDEAYSILNISEGASDAEVKRAYRRLMNQHHPDKLVAKGLPDEMMKLAAQKTDEIKKAYESVREARGFK